MKDGTKRISKLICLVILLVVAGISAAEVQAEGSAYDCAGQTAIPEEQCLALVMLYETTGGDDWTVNTNWLQSDDPCSWHGVSCVEGSVAALDLFNNNLKGELPLEIGAFPDLQTLTLNDNLLSGPIPLTITLLDLRLFHFHNTELCEPADPSFQDWLFGVVYRLSTGQYCSPLAPTETLSPSELTQVQPTSDLPWPQQTLTALAVIAATEQAVTEEPTPTKYYTLKSPTPEPSDTPVPAVEGPADGGTVIDADQQEPQADLFAGIPTNWLWLLLIPVALIVIGLLLELRERRKASEPLIDDPEISDALFKLDYSDPEEEE